MSCMGVGILHSQIEIIGLPLKYVSRHPPGGKISWRIFEDLTHIIMAAAMASAGCRRVANVPVLSHGSLSHPLVPVS